MKHQKDLTIIRIEDVIEGNKLIAEFMGATYFPEQVGSHFIQKPYFSFLNGDLFYGDVPYDSSWNYLMPVVEKIEGKDTDLGITVIIKDNICSIIRHYHSPYEEGVCWIESESKIQSIYEAVIQFIKWFNSQNKTQ